MKLRLVLIILFGILAVIFTLQNIAVVEVSFLFWSISMSRALLIFFLLIIGFIVGWFLHGYLFCRESKDESANNA